MPDSLKILLFVVATALSVATGSAAAPSSAERQGSARPTMYIVSVGIEDYASAALQQAGADDDAERVLRAFSEVARPFYAVDARRLSGASATRAVLEATFDSVSALAKEDDVVLLYFRGLGGPRFLVMADTAPMPAAPSAPGQAPPPSFEARLLRSDALADWMLGLRARQILLVLEAPEAASYFHAVRERLALPAGASRAVKDLVALATPGFPGALSFAAGPSGVLTSALTESLDEEREARGLSLVSRLLPRVLYKLDAPILVHEAGAEIVLGADAAARAAATALRDSAAWSACASDCAPIQPERVSGCCTLVGTTATLDASAKLFVNGRLARRDGARFAVELPPAALVAELRFRVLHADYSRWETKQRLP